MSSRITSGIASKNIFDTINKIGDERLSAYAVAADASAADASASDASASDAVSVSLPIQKETKPNLKPKLICMYQVRTDSLYPFILFLVECMRDCVCFPSFSGNKRIKSVSYMKTIFPEAEITYEGSYETAENTILILKAVMADYDSIYLWATSFDIMNKKKLMDYTFSPKVLDFFNANPEFLRLRNSENGIIYETPMVGYYKSNTTSRDEMDIYRETIIPALGKSYYLLTDYTAGVMRIAFFAGRMALYKKNMNPMKYDSILCCEHKRYMIKNYNQHVVLN
jgi:hypothetical protein